MKSTTPQIRRQTAGFTLIELMIVIAVIAFLVSISAAVLANSIEIARRRATETTILKVHGLVQQRIEAFNRALDRINLQPALDKMKRDLGMLSAASPKACEILVRKQLFQNRFPQNRFERDIFSSAPNPSYHQAPTESGALLYWMVTSSEVYGIPPVDESDFGSSEVRDTDGDGLLEFIDGWGHPLRFYRWPTHLFRSGGATAAPGVLGPAVPIKLTDVDRTYASLIWSGLPAAPVARGDVDPLSRDPDDPTGELARMVLNSGSLAVQVLTMLQNRFHTPDTYHAFLIVSAGPDNSLGIGEPYDCTGNLTSPDPDSNVMTLSSTTPALGSNPGQGRLAALLSYGDIANHPIVDNITNRKR